MSSISSIGGGAATTYIKPAGTNPPPAPQTSTPAPQVTGGDPDHDGDNDAGGGLDKRV
ncbi:MAG: hypothetical protein U0903_08990 [Planctomycetales bacterium]